MINELKQYVFDKKHHQYRRDIQFSLAEEFKSKKLSPIERAPPAMKQLPQWWTKLTRMFIPSRRWLPVCS